MEVLRHAALADLASVTELYNHYVRTSPATFDVDPFTVDERREWFAKYGSSGRHRLLVAVGRDELLGYASSGAHRPKAAYEASVETTVYVHPDATGRGIGGRLYAALFEALADEDVHRVYAGITMPNPASVALHQRFGFRRAGYFTEQGRKFGRWWDVAWFEKPLD